MQCKPVRRDVVNVVVMKILGDSWASVLFSILEAISPLHALTAVTETQINLGSGRVKLSP